jgi:cellulose synthase (UDP-forming)
LIILPKLLRSYWRRGLRGRLAEPAMRVHYLVSIATANVAMVVLMLVPFTEQVPVVLVLGTALPYFALYARDLSLIGRRRRDLLEVYALNLLLLPVNLGGVLTSIRQGLTGRRIPFGRTPKVSDRTAAPAGYIAPPWPWSCCGAPVRSSTSWPVASCTGRCRG